ncbi:DUF4177 domain-containing protein [Rubellimicrobium aerolatum]|uniref:DUF4177 domain-containing protein n=1 Tax=Rubellimicrobium aerolatum TaxID=490979 RepID=A0ABW0S6U9_9RHOB|nr:DUF4177 domain-containing protein [Rubellimicrobium aerolatum]MBP1804587.1 hypothetical protein [Rubellimicrobium aerolatum]
MHSHDYRVVPAPRRGLKAKGLRRPEERFANALETEMNRLAREGWEYVRTDTLPHEHKRGWFSRPVTEMRTVLVFRRPRPVAVQPATVQTGTALPSFAPPPFVAPARAAAPEPMAPPMAPSAPRRAPPPLSADPGRPAAPALHVVDPPAAPGDPRQAAE